MDIPAQQDHIITQQDLDNNPELAQRGFQVGQVVQIPLESTLEVVDEKDLTEEQKQALAEEQRQKDIAERDALVEQEQEELRVKAEEQARVDEEARAANAEQGKYFYHGVEVVEKLQNVNGEGRECKLADGTTAYVPLSEIGE